MPLSTDRKFRIGLRAAIAEIPGARAIHESFCESPGSWLYRRPMIDWLSDPALVRQLPRLYRFFASFCTVQRRDPIGAEMLLRGIIGFSKRFAEHDLIVPMQIGAMTLFLDLQDPRFLRIPTEVAALP